MRRSWRVTQWRASKTLLSARENNDCDARCLPRGKVVPPQAPALPIEPARPLFARTRTNFLDRNWTDSTGGCHECCGMERKLVANDHPVPSVALTTVADRQGGTPDEQTNEISKLINGSSDVAAGHSCRGCRQQEA